MNNCVLITCDNNYIPKAVVALHIFTLKNSDYKRIIICSFYSDDYKQLCDDYNVELIKVDLFNDFINLDDRPYGKQYPIECFYHFYAYKILTQYDYIVLIEPDIYTNKKLDIDLSKIEYIAGSCTPNAKISNFPSIKKDYDKISSVYGKYNDNICRIRGGVKIYNVKNLNKINFYEKIVDYYQTSIKINAMRCGNDSLMVMYQLLNQKHVTLLDHIFNVIEPITFELEDEYVKSIYFFHFGGKTIKYWSLDYNYDDKPLIKYFYNKTIQFIYNHFPLDYIHKYLPQQYVDISDVVIPVYFYGYNNNFGDIITPYFLEKYCQGQFEYNLRENNNKKLISCGSIMRLCNENTVVYGSGIRNIDQDIKKGNIQIVRGPLTKKRLTEIGCYCPPTFGDPGLLLPIYYKPKIEKQYKLGIVPHFIHYNIIKEMYKNENILVINLLDDNVEKVIDDVLKCEKIISSSLHGLIVSDAYDVPNKWVKFNDKICGDDTKFYDYFLSVNRKNSSFIDCSNYKQIPTNTFDLIENVDINFDINELKDNMFFDENGIKNYTKYLFKKF